MTLSQKLNSLYSPFLDSQAITCDVFHYTRGNKKTVPYIVWSETGEEESFSSDNHKTEQQLTGIVDFYTKTEFDPIIDAIQNVLNSENVGWRLYSVQWEEETNLIHYQWGWWIG